MRTLAGVVIAAIGAVQLAAPAARLTGYAVLPADTFAPGPPSGAFRQDGVRVSALSFRSQPVQGISAVWPASDGWFWALSDNGFGTRLNSPDYLLRIYRVRPLFEEKRVDVDPRFIELRDPDTHVPFHIVNENTAARLLTGADLDPESMVLMPDGTFWIGDEFGPFLLHFGAGGHLLEPPFEAPGVRSPDHPLAAAPDAGARSEATVGRSRGFEGLAYDARRGTLIALLEGGLLADKGINTRALEFNPASRRWTGRSWQIPFDTPGNAFSELVGLGEDTDGGGRSDRGSQFVAIERDNGHGSGAKFKAVFLVTLLSDPPGAAGSRGALKHGRGRSPRPLLNLLAIDDPDRLATRDGRFTFPFVTTEALWPEGAEIVLVNDNNYPATGGRAPDRRDDTEVVRVRVQ